MKVLKFGGTSVGSAQRMKEVAKLITDGEQKIVVLSAMSGTTNTLVEISDYLYKKNPEGANEIINKLEAKYKQHVDELYATQEYKQKGLEVIKSHFDYIRSYTKDLFTLFEEKVVLAQGELISTAMVNFYLQECGVKSVLLPALEFMRTDKNAEPDPVYIKDKLRVQLDLYPDTEIYITQGFICRNAYGEIDNLQRGGSDYTASLIGAAVNASEIQIWTDIDGMHNNDPRIVDKTAPVRQLHFEEAAELAYFGAKILHPTCIQPAKYANIPVRLLNTMDPEAPGTLISNDTEKGKIKAVAAKDNITAIKIKPEHAKDIILALTGNKDNLLKISKDYSDFTNTKSGMQEVAKDDTFASDFLGGQNPFTYFSPVAENIKIAPLSAYDQGCVELIQNAFSDYFQGQVDYDKAKSNFETAIKERYPEIQEVNWAE